MMLPSSSPLRTYRMSFVKQITQNVSAYGPRPPDHQDAHNHSVLADGQSLIPFFSIVSERGRRQAGG
jgi:hypothetical protein